MPMLVIRAVALKCEIVEMLFAVQPHNRLVSAYQVARWNHRLPPVLSKYEQGDIPALRTIDDNHNIILIDVVILGNPPAQLALIRQR